VDAPHENPVSLPDVMRRAGITTMEEGQALWQLAVNNLLTFDYPPQVIRTGTWRRLGELIASACGGTYLDYYDRLAAPRATLERVARKLYAVGVDVWVNPVRRPLFDWNILRAARVGHGRD